MLDARTWNVEAGDLARDYPARRYVDPGADLLLRAVNVRADPATVFRWVCQLRVAPYSYDLVDNLGRRSPRTLTPGAERLEVGQRFGVVFRIVEVEEGRQVTAVTTPRGSVPFGRVAITYDVRATADGSRLVGALAVAAHGPWQRARLTALAWGDLVMMSKQLLTLRGLAERSG